MRINHQGLSSHRTHRNAKSFKIFGRRQFLCSAFVLGTTLKTGLNTHALASTIRSTKESGINTPRIAGQYYQATIPDTLDLAERARLGVSHFLNLISEKNDYEMYWGVNEFYPKRMNALLGYTLPQPWGGNFKDYNPPAMTFNPTVLMACQGKAVEALAMLRLMSGSREGLELEAGMLRMMASNIGEDGVFYVPQTNGRRPWLGPEEWRPYANTHGQARMMRAMIAWYQYTGNPYWKEHIDRLVDGIDRQLAVHKADYAYIPISGWLPQEYFRSCYLKGRGWKDTVEPENEKAGEEGSLFNHQGHTPGALSNWYRLSGNTQSLRLAGELVRFYTKPQFWADFKGGEYPQTVGSEHAHFQGHWHGYVNTLRAILEYAVAANDPRLMAFVRDGYEWARQSGLARIGMFADSQGCACGRILGLAVKLTEAGVGDYWEDVDQYIRNHGTEMQFTPADIDHIREVGQGKSAPPDHPSVRSDRVIEATMGGFSSSRIPLKVNSGLCCCTHGNMGLFYAWDATLRHADGQVRVNLLLNRASPWLDVDSYLPYQGKVVLHNKSANEVWVRLPLWVDRQEVHCRGGDQAVHPAWFGRYLRFEGVKRGETVTIEFPIAETTETWTAPPQGMPLLAELPSSGQRFTMKFRGNTLVELSPPLAPGSWLYQGRPALFSAKQTPMKDIARYVSPIQLQW
ncbi:MAG: hypothetical protein U0V70_10295 [Terriglobia bacterium]